MNDEVLGILGRNTRAFDRDWRKAEAEISSIARESTFLVVGGAGSVGRGVVRELVDLGARDVDVVDISENSLVELVRDLRSSRGGLRTGIRTFALDGQSAEMEAFMREGHGYDYVLNLAAMKHVRSERDAYTLMRMLVVNVLMSDSLAHWAGKREAGRMFVVSSDKAANPTSAMGATKRAMERCLVARSDSVEVSSARFANVAFSDGSLISGFELRLQKRQPLAAPFGVLRYFMTHEEAARLCLLACLKAACRECFVPAGVIGLSPIGFPEIAERFLQARGLRLHRCETEDEARGRVEELAARGEWPCFFAPGDTSGEKPIEELHRADELVDRERFAEIGVILWPRESLADAQAFLTKLRELRAAGEWSRCELLELLNEFVPEFSHRETGRSLDDRM